AIDQKDFVAVIIQSIPMNLATFASSILAASRATNQLNAAIMMVSVNAPGSNSASFLVPTTLTITSSLSTVNPDVIISIITEEWERLQSSQHKGTSGINVKAYDDVAMFIGSSQQK